MTIRFVEGFENATEITCYKRKWAAFNNLGSLPTGRLHGSAAQTTGNSEWRTRSLGLQNTWTVSFGMQHPGATVADVTTNFPLIVKRGATEQIRFQFRKGTGNTFRLDIFRGVTLIGSTSDFVAQSWHFFEFQFTIDPTNGAVEVRHNTAVDFVDAGPINTANSGLAGADVFEINCVSGAAVLKFDDLFILDDQGSINNDYLGDSVIEGRRPTGDDTPLQFTPVGQANHWSILDALTCVGAENNQYVFSTTVGHQDLLAFNALSFITGQVHCVQVMSDARLNTAGSREFKHVIRSGGTLYTSPAGGSNHTVASTVHQTFFDVFELDPDTSTKWTVSGVDGADFGFEVVS